MSDGSSGHHRRWAPEWIAVLTLAVAIIALGGGLFASLNAMEGRIRDDMRTLRGDMQAMESGIREDMRGMESGIRKDMRAMESGIREDVRELRGDVGMLRERVSCAMSESRASIERCCALMSECRASMSECRALKYGSTRNSRPAPHPSLRRRPDRQARLSARACRFVRPS